MKGIYSKLPAFASDYSGASGVFFELNGFNIFCDPGSCFAATMNLDEPRFRGTGDYYSMQIREKQAVFGIDDDLLENVRKAWDGSKECITIIGTPVPTILGTDYEGLAEQLENEFQVPVFAINTSGLYGYDIGQKKAFYKLTEKIVNKQSDNGVDVNIIGATPLDMWDLNQVKEIIALLKECGAKEPIVWGRNGKLTQIEQGAGAKLNIAVSASAIPTVKYLKEKYGTPYICDFPIGKTSVQRWTEEVASILMGNTEILGQRKKSVKNQQNADQGLNAVIIGEQITSNAIRDMLIEEFGYREINVGSLFMMDESVMKQNDKYLKNEDECEAFLNQKEYSLVVCDPLIYPLLTYVPKKTVPFPHMAVSSRIYKDRSPNCFGEKGSYYFEEQLKEVQM